MGKTIQIYRPKSGVAKTAREAAPISAVEEQYAKLEQELMSPRASEGKVIELVGEIDKLKGQLEAYSKNITNGGARKYLSDVKKYGDSLIYSLAVPHLKILYSNLLSQVSPENMGKLKQTLEVVGNLIKKYSGK